MPRLLPWAMQTRSLELSPDNVTIWDMCLLHMIHRKIFGAPFGMDSHSPVLDCVYTAMCQAYEESGGRDSSLRISGFGEQFRYGKEC